jgi:hypothetical protein
VRSHFDSPIAHWREADRTPQHLRTHLFGVGSLARTFSAKIELDDLGGLNPDVRDGF